MGKPKVRREKSYESPFGGKTQTVEEFNAIHDRWVSTLMAALPEGVPAHDSQRSSIGPWPMTWGRIINGQAQHDGEKMDAYLLQCGACVYYVPIEGALGGDWGACTNARSQYDRQCVFEHWTSRAFRKD